MIERGWLKSHASTLVCITSIIDLMLLVVSGFISGYIKFTTLFNLSIVYYWVILTCALLTPIIFSFFKVYILL